MDTGQLRQPGLKSPHEAAVDQDELDVQIEGHAGNLAVLHVAHRNPGKCPLNGADHRIRDAPRPRHEKHDSSMRLLLTSREYQAEGLAPRPIRRPAHPWHRLSPVLAYTRAVFC